MDIETRTNGAVKLVRALHELVDNEVDTRLGANQKVRRKSRGRVFAAFFHVFDSRFEVYIMNSSSNGSDATVVEH